MASGGRESVFSSDEEDLHCVKKRSKRPKAIVTSDSDSDSDKDFDKRPRKHVRPLDLASDESDNKYSNEASFSNETRVCSNSNEDSSLINDLSDNEQSEKCAICLGKFADQDVATPETCDHMFCLDCLREWAKNVNTCPIDRLKFNLILVRHRKEDKIFKRISVNSPDSPWLSESESESIFSSETALCAYCDEHDDTNCLYSCRECERAFHSRCLSHQSFHLLARSGTCPDCALSISVRRFQTEQLRLRRSYNFESSSLNVDSEISFYRRTYNLHKRMERVLSLQKPKVERELAHFDRRRRLISSSESSDEDTELTRLNAQQHRDRLSSRSQCTLHQKRRLLLGRSRNPALISTATSATTNSELYSVDSDDGNNDYRYDNRDHEQNHGEPSSSTMSSFSGQPRTKIITTDERENYDVVGSILQTQTLILRPDVIKLQRDGTVLLSSDSSPNSRMNSSASSSSGNEERFTELPPFSNSRSIIPHTDGVNYKQQPLNPTQNSNSKYRETNRENYTCTSSTSKESSIDCDNMSISSRNAFHNSGNERYNDNSCSSVTHKSFCSSPTTEDIKKVSNFKESSKTHHSEDEVDIYSDIESIGDDEGICSTIEGVGDRLEPMEMAYKEDQSPSSNPEAATDSSDNELVIDEDMAAEEESDNRKESIQMNNIKNKCENEQVNESEESNVSYSDSINEEQKNGTPDVQDNSSCVDSRSVEDGQLGEESSQETFQSDGGAEGYKADSECDGSKYGSECDESRNGSEYEENKNSECEENKNESEYEESKNETEYMENKNGSEYGEEKNRSEDEDNDESVTEEIKNVSEYDDQESDMDVQVYEDNSVDSSKKSPRPETCTPCSTISSPKQYDEEMKEQESLDQCDNSISSGVQDFDDGSCRKDCENVDVSLMQTNENTSGSFSQAEENENYQHENNSNLSFESSQNVMSEPEEEIESNMDVSQTFSEGDKKLDEVQNEIRSTEYNNDEKENEINDIDFSENASTPCLDENIDGQIEDSPVHNDTVESADPDFKSDATEYDPKSCRTPPSGSEYEMVENDEISLQKTEEHQENSEKNIDNAVDLGIEDISEAGSGDLEDDFADENVSFSESKEQIYVDAKREDHVNFGFNEVNNDLDFKVNSKHSDDVKYQNSSQSNQSFEEREEGEIIEDKPVRHPDHKRSAKFERYHDENEDYSDLPRVNISDLPRIPKIKRDKEKESVPEELPIENKRTSVLGRVDLGGGDISWKRLSKHTRERSYRDGRAKEERVLYRERESRKRDKKYSSDNEWRSDSKSSRRDDTKKDSEKLRNEYDSRSRKNDRKISKVSDWDYSDRDKRNKSHKDKHKDKHRDKKEKPKHDKGKHSKDDMKYSRERSKDDRYERELKLDKEQRFERVVHEKGKCKDKDHKNKHKDRKNDNKSGKDHSREKHKHIYVTDHFSEKQREREVRKIDDKLKIVVEQKEGRKEKLKHKDKKESKHDKKQIHHHEHRKKEVERSPYTELTSIESKEIFAKGDSIIINVSFNRTNSPKDTNIDNTESSFKDRKSEEFEVDDVVTSSDKSKKHSLSDKGKSILETPITKRPVTPPERTNPVLSVSECYWQGGEDSDANSVDSEKSVIEITNIEEENDTMESADPLEGENFSSSFNSNDATETQAATKEITSESDKTPERIEKVDNSFVKESENLAPPPKRRSPRSPSPPSPADNDSYDPCEPTRSPSPPPMPPAPPLPTGNPKPPPSPELPPLPPEPEPIDNIREETIVHKPSEFSAVSSVVTSSQPVTANTQTSVSNPISMSSMLLPPPSFMSHTPTTTNSIPSLSSLLPPNFSFQVNNHPNVMFQSNHVQQVIHGIVPSQMHGTSAIPPPPNPPSLPHMSSVPPPPPPPSAMALISQVRHSQMNVRPTITPNQILQNLTMGHPVTMPQMQLTHMHHLPPNLSNTLNNHQSPMMIPSQNQSLNLPVSIQNQPVSRVILSQNQMLNHSVALQNQNIFSKPQGSVMSHQSVSNNTQKSDKVIPEKTEVIDMDVDSPYSPGDSPSMDSVCDYSPTCSPLPSSPKSKDIFDSLLPSDHRTSDRKTQDMLGKTEKLKRSKNESDTPNKRAKHEHKRHSVRMQLADKNKSRREQRVEKKLDDSQLKILDELPSSAVEMQVKEKFLKKLNRQERVVEEVKLVLKPYYKTRDVTKEEYKDILRKAVPKICHNKSGEINPVKVRSLVESYVRKIKHSRKKSDKKKSSKLS